MKIANFMKPEILLVILIWSYFFKYSIEIFHKNIASLHRFTLCGLCNLKHQMKKLLQKKKLDSNLKYDSVALFVKIEISMAAASYGSRQCRGAMAPIRGDMHWGQ